jgi:hypothetical protein
VRGVCVQQTTCRALCAASRCCQRCGWRWGRMAREGGGGWEEAAGQGAGRAPGGRGRVHPTTLAPPSPPNAPPTPRTPLPGQRAHHRPAGPRAPLPPHLGQPHAGDALRARVRGAAPGVLRRGRGCKARRRLRWVASATEPHAAAGAPQLPGARVRAEARPPAPAPCTPCPCPAALVGGAPRLRGGRQRRDRHDPARGDVGGPGAAGPRSGVRAVGGDLALRRHAGGLEGLWSGGAPSCSPLMRRNGLSQLSSRAACTRALVVTTFPPPGPGPQILRDTPAISPDADLTPAEAKIYAASRKGRQLAILRLSQLIHDGGFDIPRTQLMDRLLQAGTAGSGVCTGIKFQAMPYSLSLLGAGFTELFLVLLPLTGLPTNEHAAAGSAHEVAGAVFTVFIVLLFIFFINVLLLGADEVGGVWGGRGGSPGGSVGRGGCSCSSSMLCCWAPTRWGVGGWGEEGAAHVLHQCAAAGRRRGGGGGEGERGQPRGLSGERGLLMFLTNVLLLGANEVGGLGGGKGRGRGPRWSRRASIHALRPLLPAAPARHPAATSAPLPPPPTPTHLPPGHEPAGGPLPLAPPRRHGRIHAPRLGARPQGGRRAAGGVRGAVTLRAAPPRRRRCPNSSARAMRGLTPPAHAFLEPHVVYQIGTPS